MHIAFDAQSLVSQPSGIGNYLRNLVGKLACFADVSLTLIANRPIDDLVQSVGRIKQVTYHWPYNYLTIQTVLPKIIARIKPDLYHAVGVWEFPFYCPVPAVVTIHDLKPVIFPQTFGNPLTHFLYGLSLNNVIRKAKLIITDSKHSKRDLEKILGFQPGRVSSIYLGVEQDYERESSEKRFSREHLLYVGVVDYTKNLGVLIKALSLLYAEDLSVPKLVIVTTSRNKWRTQLERETSFPPLSEKVVFREKVNSSELRQLYRRAVALLHPTFYEGFGLPILEAMAVGTPVIASKVSSIPEVLGDAGIMIDEPTDALAWVRALKLILSDEGLRALMSANAQKRAQSFQWEITAQKTLEVYKRALND